MHHDNVSTHSLCYKWYKLYNVQWPLSISSNSRQRCFWFNLWRYSTSMTRISSYSLPPWLPPFLLFISMVPKFIILHLINPPMPKLSSLLNFPYDHHISFCSSHTPQLHHNSFRSSSHGHNGLGELIVITKSLLNLGIQISPGCGW